MKKQENTMKTVKHNNTIEYIEWKSSIEYTCNIIEFVYVCFVNGLL